MKQQTCSVAIDEIEEQGHERPDVEKRPRLWLLVNERFPDRSPQSLHVHVEGTLTVSF